jgi:REP element-mobilizing transposase RayT
VPFVIRKDIRLPSDHYVGQRIYFVTICCEGRAPFFSPAHRCKIAIEALERASDSMHFLAHAYCVMPDHTHILAEGNTSDANLVRFVAHWKQSTGYLLRDEGLDTYLAAALSTIMCCGRQVIRMRSLGTSG